MQAARLKTNLIIIILFFAFISCKKNEKIIDDNLQENVETLAPIYGIGGGIVLNGKLKNKAAISECGFILSTDSTQKDSSTVFLKLESKPMSSNFSFTINTNLELGKTYYVRAYAKIDSMLYGGETKHFIHNGNKPMLTTGISDGPYRLGDTLTVYGKNISTKQVQAIFNFGSTAINGKIISSTDSTVNCIIPYEMKGINLSVNLKDAALSSNKYDFSLATISISSYTPTTIYAGDELEIYGENFGTDPSKITVTFNYLNAKVISSSRNKIVVEVPKVQDISPNKITVITQNQSVTASQEYQFGLPTYVDKHVSLKYGDTFLMYGKNLHLVATNSFLLNDNLATAQVETTSSYAKLVLPYFIAPHRKSNFSFTYKFKEYTYQDITITDKWYWAYMMPFVPDLNSNAFTVNNEVYILSKSRESTSYPYLLYKFDPESYAWSAINIPNNVVYATAMGNRTFLVTMDKELLELKNGSTTKLTNLPNVFSGNISMKADNGKVFTLINMNYVNADMYFYIYNEVTNSWQKKANPSINFLRGSESFIINHVLYVFDSQNNMWQYNESADKWIQKASAPYDSRAKKTVFVYDGKAYCVTSDLTDIKERLLIYDPVPDIWINNGYTTGLVRQSMVGFTLNNQFYFGGYLQLSHNSLKTDLIQTEAFKVTSSSGEY